MTSFEFLIPGDIGLATGGYVYDREVIARAGGALSHVALPGGFPSPSPADLEAVRDRLARATGPVLIDGLAGGVLPAEMVAAAPVPIVALCHHPLGLETGLAPERAATLLEGEAEVLAACAHVVVTSRTTARALERHLGVAADDITVAEPGLARRDPAPRTDAVPVILTVASLTPRKGHDVLLAALERVRDRAWRALWIGADTLDPDWAAQLEEMRRASPVGDRIARQGTLDAAALSEAYGGAHVFCLPSHYEGYGMAFAEAMMAGLPVVACAAGAVPEVVPESAGLLVEPGDPIALGNALDRVLRDGELAGRMAAAGHAHALTLPDWDDTAATILDVLRGVAR